MQLIDTVGHLIRSRKGSTQIQKDSETRHKGTRQHRPQKLELQGIQKDQQLLIRLNQECRHDRTGQSQENGVMQDGVDGLQGCDAIAALFPQARE